MRRFCCILLFLLPFSLVKAEDVTIGSVDEFRAFATDVNGGNSYAGVIVRLTASLDLSGVEWIPIGTVGNPFNGTFDGMGHWVSNLTVNVAGSITGDVAGLFGCIGTEGIVKRVGVRSGSIHISSKSQTYVNCYVGGIVGLNQGHVLQCANFAMAIGNWTMANVGGIAGANGNIGGGTTTATIENCYNRGDVFTTTTSVSDGNYLGGIVGNTDGTVRYVYSYATVSSAAHQGGVCGESTGTVEHAYATNDMEGYALDGQLNTQGDYSIWTFTEDELPELACMPFSPQGDINLNGTVDIADLTLLVNMFLGNEPLNYKADVDGDNDITTADIMMLADIILKKN